MTTETPRPDQIQANVAAALSRLRGEVVHTTPDPKPVTPAGSAMETAGEASVAPAPAVSGMAAPTLTAPDPSMALSHSSSGIGTAGGIDGNQSPIMRMTGIRDSEQPDLLAGIGITPPPLADLPDADAETVRRRRRLRNRLLAGIALAMALGIFWVISGDREEGAEPIPVITADATPEKVKPIDEGGLVVPNTGVTILNGDGGAAGPETVLPPPEQPAPPPVPVEAGPVAPAVPPAPSVVAPPVDEMPSVPVVAEPPVSETTTAGTALPVPAAVEPAATEGTSAEGANAAPEVPAAAVATAEPATAVDAAGSVRIQLAAVKTEAAAAKEWARLQKAYPAILGGLSVHVEKFSKSDSEVFYRLQAGPFAGKAEAKQACADLKTQNQACIVAK